MVDSVSGTGAFAATEGLRRSNTSLRNSLSELSTGQRVSSAQDDAATFAIAQQLRSETAGLSSVSSSLARASSQVDVSIAATTQAEDTLNSLRSLAIRASDEGLDDASRAILNEEFSTTLSSFNQTLDGAEFGGVNVLTAGGGDISAITSADGEGSISVSNLDLSLGGANLTLTDTASIATAADASAALTAIDQSLEVVSSAQVTLGTTSNTLETSQQFATTLSNTVEEGIGNLVDADLAETAADIEAQQVAVALGTVALNITNASEGAVLGLFEDAVL